MNKKPGLFVGFSFIWFVPICMSSISGHRTLFCQYFCKISMDLHSVKNHPKYLTFSHLLDTHLTSTFIFKKVNMCPPTFPLCSVQWSTGTGAIHAFCPTTTTTISLTIHFLEPVPSGVPVRGMLTQRGSATAPLSSTPHLVAQHRVLACVCSVRVSGPSSTQHRPGDSQSYY